MKTDMLEKSQSSGTYTANLLGNIRSHLAGLQGFDVMALELIQNADDSKAEEIVFDITDEGLHVTNSGQFTYCGELNKVPCKQLQSEGYGCDFHRIVDVGSGGKLSHNENIGRFGIGFVSTYQITDHPEIKSTGIKLVLHPEAGQWFVEPFDLPNGTTFFLPWANDPETEGRLALGVSHITQAHIEQLTDDFQKVLRKSLLFLRHVRKAEVRQDGKLLLACDLERKDESTLTTRFSPGGNVEEWHILRADASKAAEELYEIHPSLKALDRSTEISVGLRIKPETLADGLLYAFLPTEQPTGLPMHLNADFFPEPDRKAIIFAGHQHQQEWNEILIDAAASELASDPESLLEILGPVQLWKLLSRAFELSNTENHPECFSKFWERFKETAPQSLIVPDLDETLLCPDSIYMPRTPLTANQAKAFKEIGGRIAAENLRSYQTAMGQLGAPILTLERFVNLLSQATEQQSKNEGLITEKQVEEFYRPLWSIINDLLTEGSVQSSALNKPVLKLSKLPIVLTEDFFLTNINQTYKASETLDAKKVALILPTIAIASCQLQEFSRVSKLIRPLNLGTVVSHLSMKITYYSVEDVIGVEPSELQDLYSLFADLDRQSEVAQSTYSSLRGLPLWLSSTGLIKADQALLPGDFTDPIGVSNLLDVNVLSPAAREFVSSKLEVETQNIEAFVRNVLPRAFSDNGPIDEKKYRLLLSELAKHPALINDEDCLELLGSLPIIPTQDGRWAQPPETYRRTDDLVKVLGDTTHLWVDVSRVPDTRSVHNFIDSLGIRQKPSAQHLVERMVLISESSLPSEDSKRACAEAFYALCDNYEELEDEDSFSDALEGLQTAECFPAESDNGQWHFAEDLYAPYQSKAFNSQARILDFRNRSRLNRTLLEELGVTINPETSLVIDHLMHCVEQGVQPSTLTYQVLNDRAQKDDELIAQLSRSRCIYVEILKEFVRPNQLYWIPQKLGHYAYTIPENLDLFRPLFIAIGVKNAPEAKDYVDVLLDIVGNHFEQLKTVTGVDRAVYDTCLSGIASEYVSEELDLSDLSRLQLAPTILNLMNQPILPDEIFLQDSEWLASYFNGELDRALCKPHSELWSLFGAIGVKRLTECAEVKLEFLDGNEVHEEQIAQTLLDKTDILLRLLHDKKNVIKHKLIKAVSTLKVVSYDVVRIQAEANYGDNPILATPTSTHAFYEAVECMLILARPITARSWSHILNALFHQLMPEEAGGEISKLTLSIRLLMSMSTEDAHLEMTDAGFPLLELENSDVEDLTSPQLENFGGAQEPEDNSDDTPASEATEATQDGARTKGDINDQPSKGEASEDATKPDDPPEITPRESPVTTPEDNQSPPEIDTTEEPSGGTFGTPPRDRPHSGQPSTKKREKHKTQWDRRLLSYVRNKIDGDEEFTDGFNSTEHNLAVEVIARDAVCTYEKARGRVPEQMPQTHPGYDIISRDSLTGEERFIEVKGINGEWNLTGVGLSKLQFSNAQDYGDSYWLYVVELISDPENLRVHPICSPAKQVTAFMFDGKWRDTVTEESADPSLAFIKGARVRHQHYGAGQIVSMKLRGSTRVMIIDFEQGGEKTVSLNLRSMEVIEDDYGEDDS